MAQWPSVCLEIEGFKLFANITSRRQKSPLTRDGLRIGRDCGYNECMLTCSFTEVLDWLQSLKQFIINVSCHILVASLTLMVLLPSEKDQLQVYDMTH